MHARAEHQPGQLDPGLREPLAPGASDVGSPPALSSLLSGPILLQLLLLGLKRWWLGRCPTHSPPLWGFTPRVETRAKNPSSHLC